MNDKEIKITGLNSDEMAMLDIIWSLQSHEDHVNWLENLDSDELEMALSLTTLLALEVLDMEEKLDLSSIKNYLKKFQLK